MPLTPKQLKEVLDYNPRTGQFIWIAPKGGRVHSGDIAGSLTPRGYIQIHIKNKLYKAHRLAWLWMTGKWPTDEIDHKNGIKDDNRWKNLRECNRKQNCQNRAINCNNKTGYMGVFIKARNTIKKYAAEIRINKKKVSLGYFKTPEEAHAAYLKAKAKYHTFNPTIRE